MENNETFGDFLKKLNINENIDNTLDDLNKEEDTKKLLAAKIESDIQQYLPDAADVWGDEKISVKIKDDDAFVVWKDHWMPTIDFYTEVFKNGGVVCPENFDDYGLPS